ncbi:hypothetical protein [Mycolicibacterium tusciae]|uniref:Uncharacterized protein n=1 Tax=Mycolicibacterium tusciae TaxID=75922 RepID=A0A1X0JD50_9MYCO|nr:hypothetical protein [Mycolicibacterium tusciae]ORB60661.1 hypothetical protein BST47_29535 [Mycolicibacterium tusciae]
MNTTDDDTDEDDRLIITAAAGAAALMVGFVAWTNRFAVLAALTPYGLTEANRTPFHGDPFRPEVITDWRPAAGWHLTASGWVALAVVTTGLLGLIVGVGAVAAWVRWWRRGGTDEVPPIPAAAVAAVAAAAGLAVALFFVPGRLWLAVLAAAVLAAAAWRRTATVGRRYRLATTFAGRADQVLGHGHPGPGRVRARGWRVDDEHGGEYPAKIEATCGPGWQHAPSELAALGHYAYELGWPGYEWRYDPMRKRVTGLAALS